MGASDAHALILAQMTHDDFAVSVSPTPTTYKHQAVVQTAWHLYEQLRALPKHCLRCSLQEALFPNCSFQAPCNGWTICNNFRGKAITRARDIIEMYHHRNRIQDTCGWQMHAAWARKHTCSNAALQRTVAGCLHA